MNTINSIQVLRGIAAILVVLVHILDGLDRSFDFFNIKYFGHIGVDIFFVISGFIMILIHGDDFLKQNAAKKFLIKRIIRIVPLYWIFTIFAALILVFFPELFSKGKEFQLDHFISSLFFIPWYNSVGEIVPLLGVGWTLNFEMYFYIIFALSLFFPKKFFLFFISFIFVGGFILVHTLNVDFPYLIILGKPVIFEFLFGVYIGWLYRKGKVLENTKLWFLLSCFLISINLFFHFNIEYRVLFYGIPSAILIYSSISLEQKYTCKFCNKYLLILGSASYSIYITHVFFYKAALKIYNKFIMLDNMIMEVLFALGITVCGGILIYYILEKPLYKYMKNLYEGKL